MVQAVNCCCCVSSLGSTTCLCLPAGRVSQQGPRPGEPPLPLFLWAMTRVLSRGLAPDKSNKSTTSSRRSLTLVPYLDMANHR